MQDAILQIQRLSLAYPPRRGHPAATILDDISVDIERGSALTLVGPSGSGKSSLLRCLNRLEEPTAGIVRFGGRLITELDPRELRRRVALVQQTAVLFEGTVRDNLMVHAPGVTLDVSERRLREALPEVGLDVALLERDAAMLSGGERQRVTIARALLRDPQALLLDEPTSALDPPNTMLVVDTICRLRDTRGLTIVAVTHTPDLVRRLDELRIDCGCRIGSVVMLSCTTAWVVYCLLAGRTWQGAIVRGLAVLLASGVVGKLMGLALARLRFHLTVRNLRLHLATTHRI